MKGNLLRSLGYIGCFGNLPGRFVIAARQQREGKSIFTRRGFFFRVCLFFPLFRLTFFFTPPDGRDGGGGRRGAGARLIVVRAQCYSYRYNVIADTEGGGGSGAPLPCPLSRASRYIDLFSSFAYELFRFGSPGVYSRMKICSAAKYFSVVARLCSRARSAFRPPPPFTPPPPAAPLYNACGSISSGTYLYTVAPRYIARGPVRACVRACMHDGESAELLSIREMGENREKNK